MLLNGASSVQRPRPAASAAPLGRGRAGARLVTAVPVPCDARPAPWPLPQYGLVVFDGRRDLGGYVIHGAFVLLALLGVGSNVHLSSEDNKHAHNKSVRHLVQICWKPMLVYVTRAAANKFWWKYCKHFGVMYDPPEVSTKINPVIFLPRRLVKVKLQPT
ncbi:hypothetical protein M885DRAFT_578685 [Pelagophyceae sp. CCMP2097]|nr:hypothetical protein M885DRAFT_578685 [Pelagophyceae sp. CCMP2097]